jgi:hypothetical protein
MAVPNIFANVTTSIPLSQLDTNFATAITLGNTAVYLGNTTTTLGNLTLTNVTLSSGTNNIGSTSISNGTSNVSIASSGGNITMATNGTTAITVDTTQQVGVNITPSGGGGPLQVGFNSSGSAAVRIQTTNASTAGEILNFINSSVQTAGKVIYGASQTSVVYQTTSAGQSTGATLVLNGVAFPATQVASTDANTLDDYEEGTWTPADGSGAGLNLTVNSAGYVKVGQMVFLACSVTYPTTANGSRANISGLPFTCCANNSTVGYWGGSSVRYTDFGSIFFIAVNNGTTNMDFGLYTGGNLNNNVVSTKRFDLVLMYRASA